MCDMVFEFYGSIWTPFEIFEPWSCVQTLNLGNFGWSVCCLTGTTVHVCQE